jgi:hypothetical protein
MAATTGGVLGSPRYPEQCAVIVPLHQGRVMDMFVRNLDAFTNALGVENAPTIMELSLVPWPDDTTRDAFIKDLTGYDMSVNY